MTAQREIAASKGHLPHERTHKGQSRPGGSRGTKGRVYLHRTGTCSLFTLLGNYPGHGQERGRQTVVVLTINFTESDRSRYQKPSPPKGV